MENPMKMDDLGGKPTILGNPQIDVFFFWGGRFCFIVVLELSSLFKLCRNWDPFVLESRSKSCHQNPNEEVMIQLLSRKMPRCLKNDRVPKSPKQKHVVENLESRKPLGLQGQPTETHVSRATNDHSDVATYLSVAPFQETPLL